MMNCEKARPALNALMDGELSCWTAWRVKRHLAHCGECTAVYRQIDALVAAARSWRQVTAPPALWARVAARLGLSSQSTGRAPASAAEGRPDRAQEPLWRRTCRWGAITAATALLAVLWSQSRPSSPALAAIIRATEAAPAVHFVGRGSRGTRVEGWWVDHGGAFMHSQRGRDERFDSDNRKQRLIYTIRQGQASTVRGAPAGPHGPGTRGRHALLERQLSAAPSALANPAAAERQRERYTFTRVLKQMQLRHDPSGFSSEMANYRGRRLLRLTSQDGATILYVDPRTDRLLYLEDRDSNGPSAEVMRVEIDYPDPANAERKLLRCRLPSGATRHLATPMTPAHPRPLGEQTGRQTSQEKAP